MAAIQVCGHPSFSVSCVVDWRGSIYTKWCTQSTQPASMDDEASPSRSSLLIQAQIQCQRLDRNCRWLRHRTVCDTGSSRWSAVRRFPWRNVSTFTTPSFSTCTQKRVVWRRHRISQFCMPRMQLPWQLSGKWIWRGDPIAWLQPSPYLTPWF